MSMKAIETVYDGHNFRSRIESRWAVFFNALGVPYEYEKEGFEFPNGVRYLPDFWIEQQQCWLEVKGQDPLTEDIHKIELLVEHSHQTVFIASGMIPNWQQSDTPIDPAEWMELHENDPYTTISNLDMIAYLPYGKGGQLEAWRHGGGLEWCECPSCHRVGIHWFSDQYRRENFCECTEPLEDNTPRILNAFNAARQARFEHGRHGN